MLQIGSTEALTARVITVATVQVIRPDWDRGIVAENMEQASRYLEEAGALGADIALLPENVVGMCVKPPEIAIQTVPGPATEAFGENAARHGMYIIWPDDRTFGERRSGNQTLQRRGYHRSKRRNSRIVPKGTPYNPGAEILFFPTASDGRGPVIFDSLVRERAVDNCVHLVASVYQNKGRSCIMSADGMLLADSFEILGMVTAEIDLDRRITRHEVSGGVGDLKEILFAARRSETYEKIVEPRKA